MQLPSKRNRQVADLLHRQVALLIKTKVSDPRLTQIVITSVDVSSDLKNARIYYTLPDSANKDDVALALKKAVGFIRHELSARTELRYTPKISFHYDESIAYAQHLLSLMEEIETDSDD